MRGNPEIAHDRKKVSTRLLESILASELAKKASGLILVCDLCDKTSETFPVQFEDGIFRLCEKCLIEEQVK